MAKNIATFHFIKSGLQTTIQDKGRYGHQAFGIPVSGAMDKKSAETANWLLDNPVENPVLELTLLGPKIEIEGDCQIALTGADLSPRMNGQSIPMYESIDVKNGSVLSFGEVKNGCRTYLAVRGKWLINDFLSSYSALPYNGKAATPDSIIQKHSQLQIDVKAPISKKVLPASQRPFFQNNIRVKVLPGPEFNAFSGRTIGHFFSRGYRIGNHSNRMGYRLDAEIFNFKPQKAAISSGTIPGTIQITNEGQPVILMADAQTVGGYYRIANVISEDMDKLGQLKPGDEVWFSLVDFFISTMAESF